MNGFVACILEIYVSHVGPNSQNDIELLYNEKRALLGGTLSHGYL